MPYQMRLMKLISKLVCFQKSLFWGSNLKKTCFVLELDALALEEEEEGPSYLADLNKVPDFVDEAPIEVGAVSLITFFLQVCSSIALTVL